MSNRYTVNFRVLAIMLIPAALMSPEFVALVLIIVLPLSWLYDYVLSPYIVDYLFRMSISSSVCRLEFILNKLFYPDGLDAAYNRRIVIELITYQNPEFIYLGDGGDVSSSGGIDGQPIEENKQFPLPLNSENQPIYIYTAAELGYNSGIDYRVKIPQPEAGAIDLVRLTETLKQYQLPDKVFQIITY